MAKVAKRVGGVCLDFTDEIEAGAQGSYKCSYNDTVIFLVPIFHFCFNIAYGDNVTADAM